MPTNEQLTITLPTTLAQLIRAKVAAGEYASESDFVCQSVVMNETHHGFEDDSGWGPSDEWIVHHALPALDGLEADPTRGTLLEDVEAELKRRRETRQRRAA